MNFRILTALLLLTACATPSRAAVNVFACEPEWGALATTIGGERLQVHVATTALQDVHQIQARPSLIAAIRKAQLLVCSGADLEAGWLPLLVRQAGNSAIQPGRPGYFMAASYITRLDVPQSLDRARGDLHAEGNPHVITDPRNLRVITGLLAQRLASIDPAGAATYIKAADTFDRELAARIDDWEHRAAALRGTPLVIQHNVWVYLQAWLGFRVAAALEPKPGVPPTSAHLAQVLASLEVTPAKAIVIAAYENPKAARWLAGRSGLPVIVLPYTVGGSPEAADLLGLYESTITALLTAVP